MGVPGRVPESDGWSAIGYRKSMAGVPGRYRKAKSGPVGRVPEKGLEGREGTGKPRVGRQEECQKRTVREA